MPDPRAPGSLSIVTMFTVRPEHVSHVGEMLRALVEQTRAEPGCVRYEALQSQADPVDFVVLGQWVSEDAYDRHMAAAHTLAFTHGILGWLQSGPEMRRYRPI
jgi:quinol monooxygenase YgiN